MPQFELKLENELKYAFFFKGNKKIEDEEILDEDDRKNIRLRLLKKNYILVTKDNKIKLSNLGLKKKSNSPLSRKIFWEFIVPNLIKTGQCKFDKKWIESIIMELLNKDIKLAAMRYSVGEVEQYKDSPNGIYCQIARKYGSGIYHLIPNNRHFGIGKGKAYSTVEEFNNRNLQIRDIDLSNVWSELNYFIKAPIIKNVFEYCEMK